MRLYNPKLRNYSEFREFTYHETVTVRNGFCEVNNPYSIAELKRRGFLEVAGTTSSSATKTTEVREQMKSETKRKARKNVGSGRRGSKELSRSSGIVETE